MSSNERALLSHLFASPAINSQFSQNFLYMSKGSQIGQGQPQLYTWPWVTDNIFGSGSFISCFIISTLSMCVCLLFLIINNLCPKMKMNGFTFCFLFFCDCFYHRQRICCLDRFKIILELFWTWSKSKVGLSEYSTICWSSRPSDNGLFIWKPYAHFLAIHEIWISCSKVSADYGKQNSNFVIAN